MGTGLLSPGHVVILLIVVLVVFGARRLPELGRSLGSGMREFKDSVTGESDDEHAQLTAAPAPAPESRVAVSPIAVAPAVRPEAAPPEPPRS